MLTEELSHKKKKITDTNNHNMLNIGLDNLSTKSIKISLLVLGLQLHYH